ncbi:SET domain-containing protein 3 [Echria macrotheca]|uniref:SET domain-containing protein 3 n=1 Tax=Echria macrotheca TaxID=438768 RepID=A0AAJ0BNU2_9PEZI|nr:SET domain-containing protein 3 [Echria macrotheca]
MTDRLPPLSTPIVPPSQTSHTLLVAPAQHVVREHQTVEEEPYTIKCICGFADDDGNTIYCEKCDTWQHIECYYPHNLEDAVREDFNHSCIDCDPRPLDRQQAVERQRAQRARASILPLVEEEATDKKPRRPPSKSHKKKPKPTDLHLNGHHGGLDGPRHANTHDGSNSHPPKKTKSAHKPSQSISSQAPKRSPPYGRPNHGHPPSPATTPPDLPDEHEMHGYSDRFTSHFNDQGVRIVNVNSFAGLQVSNTMSEWLRDPRKMEKETGTRWDDVFQHLPANMDSLQVIPEVEHTKKTLAPGGPTLYWQSLRAPSSIGKDVPLIELNGQIGFQAAYCQELQNRWGLLSGPLPFVLFHPSLPLYIDTRKEGSEARFVRRSCRPNASLETYLSGASEYHFWLVSTRPIAAKEQITIAWDFRFPNSESARMLRILGLADDEMSQGPEPVVDEEEYQSLAAWVRLTLSEHGGCACNLGSDCAFMRFHRTYNEKSYTVEHAGTVATVHAPGSERQGLVAPKSKKRKLPKPHTLSPTSTGHATNSRAASEGHLDDLPDHDRRSVSGSSRSKPGSRDMTPTARQGSFDQLGILTEPTDRDKRKVTMIEDSFRRMEQQQEHKTQPGRKRKRASDGMGSSRAKSTKSHSETHTPTLPSGFLSARHVADAGVSRSKSASPASADSPYSIHPPRRIGLGIDPGNMVSHHTCAVSNSNYSDAVMQAETEEGADARVPSPAAEQPKLRAQSLASWLMASRRAVLQDEAARRKRRSLQQLLPAVAAMEIDSPTDFRTPIVSPSLGREAEKLSPAGAPPPSEDTVMVDAPPLVQPLKTKSPDLRVQMPPVPAFGSPTGSAPSTATTPLSAGASLVQSPFSTGFGNLFGISGLNAANPSPVKKKLSLSDYTKSRMNKGAASRPSVGTTMLKPMASSEDPKSATSAENGSVGSPTAEKLNEATNNSTPVASTAMNEAV